MIKCPDCNCTAHSLDGHYMAKLKGQVEKVRRTRVKCKRCGRRYTLEDTSKNNLPCIYCKGKTRKTGFDKQGRRMQDFIEKITKVKLKEHQKQLLNAIMSRPANKIFFIKPRFLGIKQISK